MAREVGGKLSSVSWESKQKLPQHQSNCSEEDTKDEGCEKETRETSDGVVGAEEILQ